MRSTSVVWNAGGVSANLGLHGLRIHTESLKALLAGGVALATPPKKPGQAGTVFQVHAEAKDDWLEWQSKYSAGKGKDDKKRAEVEDDAGADEEGGDEAGQEEPEPRARAPRTRTRTPPPAASRSSRPRAVTRARAR